MSDWKKEAAKRQELALETINVLGLTMEAHFIRLSMVPENERWMSEGKPIPAFHYNIALHRGKRKMLTKFSMGKGRSPNYNRPLKAPSGGWSDDPKVAGLQRRQEQRKREYLIAAECEQGIVLNEPLHYGEAYRPKRSSDGKKIPILPNIVDVLYCIVSDCEVFNYDNFEDWALSFGYNSDSIKDRNVYDACLANALAFRNLVGAEGLQSLETVLRDM